LHRGEANQVQDKKAQHGEIVSRVIGTGARSSPKAASMHQRWLFSTRQRQSRQAFVNRHLLVGLDRRLLSEGRNFFGTLRG
jgi:hypothetical protein